MKLWQGSIAGRIDPVMERFNRSLDFDKRLIKEDLAGSLAYALALRRAGLLSAAESGKIRRALRDLLRLKGKFPFIKGDEDVHTAVERLLIKRIGSAGKKIHSGRSRNEQVALDMRLWLKKEARSIQGRLTRLMEAALALADRHCDLIMPAFTHLQAAQPVLFPHYMLSFFFMLERDHGRLDDCLRRADVMPLGSGAMAGSGFPLDRKRLARELGFSRVSDNSMDAVSDRDFVAEFLSACAILMVHLSRFAEDLVLFASPGYGFVTLSDAYSTGSSMMPNKKNPDSLELIRGKSGRVIGDLMALLAVLKGLPHTYNKDLQEDKEPLFDATDTVAACLDIFRGVLRTLILNRDKIGSALDGELLATDLADRLVKNGVPFRDAHAAVGRIVREARKKGVPLARLSFDRLREYSPAFPAGFKPGFMASVRTRNLYGGTGPSSVNAQLKKARLLLRSMKRP